MNQPIQVQDAVTTLFDEKEWVCVNQVLNRLNDSQKLWLSGYLASRPSLEPETDLCLAQPGQGSSERVFIAFGGETGNSESLALHMKKALQESALDCRLTDLAQVKVRHLAKEKRLVIICSTHGEGEPPETMTSFYNDLASAGSGSLSDLEYAVLALGDSSYDHYCKAGRDIDGFLKKAGAFPFLERVEVDVDFEKPATQWIDQVAGFLNQGKSKTELSFSPAVTLSAVPSTDAATKANPGSAELAEKIWLSNTRRSKGYWHLELLVEQLPDFKPGDALGVFPENPDALVEQILVRMQLDADSEVRLKEQDMNLDSALRTHLDLIIPGKNLLLQWADWSGDAFLRDIVSKEAATQREYLKQNQVIDLLDRFPVTPDPQQLVETLRPLQPRLYDIANFPEAGDAEIHLLVKNFQYSFNNRIETGVVSRFFHELEPGNRLKFYVHANKKFCLPEDQSRPLILIAHGSGIAPYRAFTEYFMLSGNTPPCWIIFIEQHFEEDFLYQLEWQKAVSDGLIRQFDTVFESGPSHQSVSHCFQHNKKQLSEWLEQQAHIFLCGEKVVLKQVEEEVCAGITTLSASNSVEGGLWKNLEKSGRIHRNYY